MNERSNYYQNYEPFLGGNDDPIIGYNLSYEKPIEPDHNTKPEDRPKEIKKEEDRKNWNMKATN